MPSTFQAAWVVVLFLLPGALHVWAFERQAGRYGIGLSDRVLRFVGGSSLLVALLAGPLYALYVRFADVVRLGRPLPWWLAAVPVVYVSIPLVTGTTLGLAVRRGWNGIRWLTGPDLAPRAWDHLFQYDIDGWVRCRMRSGTWLGGAFAEANGTRSYAAGYPEAQDLYLAATVEVDPETGEFIVGDDGLPTLQASGLLVRWEEVEYLEFTNA